MRTSVMLSGEMRDGVEHVVEASVGVIERRFARRQS